MCSKLSNDEKMILVRQLIDFDYHTSTALSLEINSTTNCLDQCSRCFVEDLPLFNMQGLRVVNAVGQLIPIVVEVLDISIKVRTNEKSLIYILSKGPPGS